MDWRERQSVGLRGRPVGTTPDPAESGFDAFISYSHDSDRELAIALQRGLHRLAKPWFRVRALRVFRDDGSLSANPALWNSIERSLDSSAFMILLASPASASSPWVRREIAHWLATKGTDRLLIGLTGGEIRWNTDAQDFDWDVTDALPESLQAAFVEEPRFIDLRWARTSEQISLSHPRFRDALSDFAAPLHGKAKDELASDDVREHRRAVRIARAGVTALVALMALAVVASIIAIGQRNVALARLRVAEARQLAQRAVIYLQKGQQDKAALLAIQAYRLAPVYEARDAMVRVLETTHNIAGHVLQTPLGDGSYVEGVGFSRDGRYFAATGQRTHAVTIWDAHNLVPVRRLDAGAASTVAFGASSNVLVTAGVTAPLASWSARTGVALHTLRGPRSGVRQIAISRDGKWLAAADGSRTVDLWEVATGRLARTVDAGAGGADAVAFGGDGVLAAGGGASVISVWNAAGRHLLKRLPAGLASAHDRITALALSPDGRTLVSATRQQAQVIVWDTQAARPLFPQLALADSTDAVTGLSFSADGSTFAVGEGGKQVELFDRVTAQPLGTPLTDPLGGGVGPVAFAPDGASLLTGPRLRLWTPLALSRGISAVASRLCTFAQRNLTRLEWHLLLPDQPYQKTCAQWPVKAR